MAMHARAAVVLASILAVIGCAARPPAGAMGTEAGVQAASRRGGIDTPQWARHAVFYQIFPERFANGNPQNDPKGAQGWGGKPELNTFFGGDLEGIIQKLPYLKETGVTALYLNPVFKASSNHKYNTSDYTMIDPAFGDEATFRRLVRAAHASGIKLILDGVFNHTGDDHYAFIDCKALGSKSKYWSWYTIWGFPVVTEPKPNYNAWWGFHTLPQLRAKDNPDVQKHLFDVVEHWTRAGIDGWRLDVPNEIDSDAFWQTFRRKVRAINPEAYIVGEIWEDATRWLQGDQFDSVMNYPFRTAVLDFFAHEKVSVDDLDARLGGLRSKYDPAVTQVMFNILGSHDVPRLITEAGGDVRKLQEMVLLQMTYPGTPVVYYGDEVGLEGGKDPDNRRCFPWSGRRHGDLTAFYRKLITLRHGHPELRTGTFRSLLRHNHHRLFAYVRELGNAKAIIVMNSGAEARGVDIDVRSVWPDGTAVVDALGGRTLGVAGGKLAVSGLGPKQHLLLFPASRKR